MRASIGSAAAGDLRRTLARLAADFRGKAPLSASGAAAVVLDGVRPGAWRILVGEDARRIDAAVRARPEAAYDYAELFSAVRHPQARDPDAGSWDPGDHGGEPVRNGGT